MGVYIYICICGCIGFRVQNVGISTKFITVRVPGVGFRMVWVESLGFRVEGLWFRGFGYFLGWLLRVWSRTFLGATRFIGIWACILLF